MPIRIATPADVPGLTALINDAYVVERFFKVGDRIDAARVGALQQRGSFLLLESDGRLVGSVYLELREGRGYIGLLAVDPARQGSGFARLLMTAAEERCLANGVQQVDLRVVNLREDLPPLYRRLGYRESGTEPFSDPSEATRPCHFVVMTKALGPARP